MAESPLAAVADWKLEEKGHDNLRYFFSFDEVTRVENGRNCFVIGRKGSGKTAVAEHLHGLVGPETFVTKLSFKDFPFRALYKLKDEGYTRQSQYITLWKYVIYCAVCAMMARNQAIDQEVAADLRKAFDVDLEKALSQSLSYLTDRSLNLKIMGVGGGGQAKTTVIDNTTPWFQRVEILEQVIETHAGDAAYFVLFDELDEDYRDPENARAESEYLDLLTGLFKAAYHVQARFSGGRRIYPVVFLRDDIFALIRDPDRNKWSDVSSRLTWDQGLMQQLLAFRIGRAIDPQAGAPSFDEAWLSLFESAQIPHGKRAGKQRRAFNHVTRRTMMRPRDTVVYLREAARAAQRNGEARISVESMRQADAAFSDYFAKEIVDEMFSSVPEIEEVFDLLSELSRPVFDLADLRALHEPFVAERDGAVPFDRLCELLFQFSAIGKQTRVENRQIYRYESPRAKLGRHQKVCVHRGLLHALQIF